LVPYFKTESSCKSVQVFGDRLHVSFQAPLASAAINRLVQSAPHANVDMRQIEPGIEDTFMALMRNEASPNQ
jgi:hypothetical protein